MNPDLAERSAVEMETVTAAEIVPTRLTVNVVDDWNSNEARLVTRICAVGGTAGSSSVRVVVMELGRLILLARAALNWVNTVLNDLLDSVAESSLVKITKENRSNLNPDAW